MCKILAGLSKSVLPNKNGDKCCYNFDTVMNSIKILDSLKIIFALSNIYLKTILPKFDLSQTKRIKVDYTYSYLKREILEMITPISLEEFGLGCDSGAEIIPALLAFQKCPKLKTIGYLHCSDVFNPVEPILTKNVLKEILLTKREKKIEYMHLAYESEVDRDDFMNFMNNHLAFDCEMRLALETHEIFDAFVRMLDEIQEIRQKESKIS